MSEPVPTYRERAPGVGLQDLVECYWESRGEGSSVRVMPDGCADLLLDDTGAATFVGTMSRARVFEGGAGRDLVAVRFRPGGARALLGLPVHELVDVVAPLASLGPELPAARWRRSGGSLVPHLEAFLRSRLPHVSARDREAARLARAVASAPESRVQATADRLGISRQHLRRRVLDATGIGPKHLARIGRLRRTAEQIQAGARPDARLAVRHGYFDQAHLAREFRSLAQISPTGYAAERF